MNHAPRFFSLKCDSRRYLTSAGGRPPSPSKEFVSWYPGKALQMDFGGGRSWPPCVSNTEGMIIVQKSLAVAMVNAGLQGVDECYPVKLDGNFWNEKRPVPPEYVWIRSRRDILLDPAFLIWPYSRPAGTSGLPYRLVPIANSHGGSDVFGVKGLDWTSLFCTRRFIEAARQNRWKGFLFRAMDIPCSVMNQDFIDYLGKEWPPTNWYPAGVEGHPNNLDPG